MVMCSRMALLNHSDSAESIWESCQARGASRCVPCPGQGAFCLAMFPASASPITLCRLGAGDSKEAAQLSCGSCQG